MSYNTKNYTEQGGEKTVIGGTLEIKEGAVVTGLPEGAQYTLPAATAGALGGVVAAGKEVTDTVEVKIGQDNKLYAPEYPAIPVANNQAASTAADVAGLVADFNTLLGKLKASGLMTVDTP